MEKIKGKKFYQTDDFRLFMGKYGIGVVLVFMIIIIAILKPRFISLSNILNVMTQISVNCLIAYGMCLYSSPRTIILPHSAKIRA